MTRLALRCPLSIIEMALRLMPDCSARSSWDTPSSLRRFFNAAAIRPENSWDAVSFNANL